jgi:hypothetical protein
MPFLSYYSDDHATVSTPRLAGLDKDDAQSPDNPE